MRATLRLLRAGRGLQDEAVTAVRAVLSRAQKDEAAVDRIAAQLSSATVRELRLAAMHGSNAAPASQVQLGAVFAQSMVPFVAFGALDNAMMLVFADAIDSTMGVALGMSTLAAAAAGNALSDVLGVGLVDPFRRWMGLRRPALSPEQWALSSVRWARYYGSAAGVLVGCILGCLPLLWLDTSAADKVRRRQHVDRLLQVEVQQIAAVLGADKATLYAVDHKHKTLVVRVSQDVHFELPMDTGLAGAVATTGEAVRVKDARQDARFYDGLDRETGYETRSVLAVPVRGSDGRVHGVLQLLNSSSPSGEFSEVDERQLKMLCKLLASAAESAAWEEFDLGEAIECALDG